MTRSGASLTAMLVPTVWRMGGGLMGLVMAGGGGAGNCGRTGSGASLTAMLVPTVWRMECGLMGLVMPAARTYFFTMFWTERVVRGLSLPTRDVRRGLRASMWELRERPERRTYRWTRRQRSGE